MSETLTAVQRAIRTAGLKPPAIEGGGMFSRLQQQYAGNIKKDIHTKDAEGKRCPRCSSLIVSAKLTAGTEVDYCEKCKIAIPISSHGSA